MNAWMLLLSIWAISATAMIGLWSYSMRERNVGYVDVGWAGLMTVAALLAATLGDGSPLMRTLVALFGGAWGARLCVHLLNRVLHEGEDGRYQALRAGWDGSHARFFVFFQLQALVVTLFALPFIAVAWSPRQGFDAWILAGSLVWLVGVGGETLADRQLSVFRSDPANAGRTCRKGLWGWSRHPNYFFEWLHWFAYVLLAVGSPHAWMAWVGPVAMLGFLYRVSGIPWTEEQALRSRGDEYRRYQRDVSAFVPLPPRQRA